MMSISDYIKQWQSSQQSQTYAEAKYDNDNILSTLSSAEQKVYEEIKQSDMNRLKQLL